MKTMKKIVAILAVALMLFSVMPLSAFAADAVYEKITTADELTTGSYVMVVSTGYAPGVYDNKWVTAIQPTISNDTITNPSGCVVTLTVSGSTVKIQDNSGNYLKPTANSNAIGTGDYSWTWACTNGTFTFADSGNTVLLASNKSSSNKFRGYKKATATGNPSSYPYQFTLYKLAATEPEVPSDCEHDWELISTTDATCTAEGEEYYECSGCGESKTEAIDALGHSYGDPVETVAPTCTTAGEQESVCSACDDVKTETIDALGHSWDGDSCSVCGTEKPAGYAPITSADQFVSGQYVMMVQTGYAPTYFDGSWVLTGQPEMDGDIVLDATGYLWNLTVDGNSVTITDANGVSIAPKGGNNNGIQSGAYAWKWTFDNGKFIFAGTDDDTVYLASNATAGSGDHKFRGYKTTTCSGSSSYSYEFTLYAAVEEKEEDVAISFGGNSVSDDVSGLGFKFDVAVSGLEVTNGTKAVYDNAYIGEYKLISMGAIVSNDKSNCDIAATYLCDLDAENGTAAFAVRIIKIPEANYATDITAIPYYVVEIDGEEVTIYGEAVTASYDAVLNG